MMFGFNNKKKEQDVIQKTLQSENNVFHGMIVALERLESHLTRADNTQVGELKRTAVGTSRDRHATGVEPSAEMCFVELSMDCGTLYLSAHYDDPEIFKIAVEAFLNDLLEWYGGRSLLEYYDEVDASVIPIVAALSRTSKNIDALFEKYVYKASDLSDESVDDKYNAMKSGMNSWIKAQMITGNERKTNVDMHESELITSHFRGNALDGYKRIIAALTNLFSESAPLKMFVNIVSEYLPEVSSQLPSINTESIDNIYNQKEAYKAPADPLNPEAEGLSEDSIKIDLSGLDDENSTIPASNNKESEELAKDFTASEKEEKELSKEETYSRILKLADEIIALVKSLKSEK